MVNCPNVQLIWLQKIARNSESLVLILENDVVKFAFSDLFLGRVEEWFYRLLEEDLERLLKAAVPPLSVFMAFSVVTTFRNQVGLWLWERFTVTNLADWSMPSLMLEYRWGKGEEFVGVSRRILADRTVALEDVIQFAMERGSNSRLRQIRRRGLDPSSFAESAAEQLKVGNFRTAENIFSGLIELRSTDGEAWNNLGFCQIASDPKKALASLRRAAVFQRNPSSVNIANQVLALHLLQCNDEAVSLGNQHMPFPRVDGGKCFLWHHPHRQGNLEIQTVHDIGAYMASLIDHIRVGECAPKFAGTGTHRVQAGTSHPLKENFPLE